MTAAYAEAYVVPSALATTRETVTTAPVASATITNAPTPLQTTNYKTTRIREMAEMWKGTVLEERTVPLLAMLLVENGALAETVRGDYGYAIGLDQTHICIRGFLKKQYCGAGAEARLAEALEGTEWETWLTDWRTQFRYYTVTVEGMTKDGRTVDQIIKSWNSREVGRRNKVRNREPFVRDALAL